MGDQKTVARIECDTYGEENKLPEKDPDFLVKQSADFNYGSPDPLVDYLIVLDNSSSMDRFIKKVNKSFLELVPQTDLFSKNSRLAVMTTMLAEGEGYDQVHYTHKKYQGINEEPGFLDFVNRDSIQKFRSLRNSRAFRFPLDGCQEKWFKPEQKDEQGNYCISAALQVAGTSLIAEAGINAFEQLIRKHKKQIFRKNAYVHVIFVSDTHDPGMKSPELSASIKDYETLRKLTLSRNKIADLRFHGITPHQKCANEGTWDYSYNKLISDSGGMGLDLCVADDYSDFFREMIIANKNPEPAFSLQTPVQRVSEVTVDGRKTSQYQVDYQTGRIKIPSLKSNRKSKIRVKYLQSSGNGCKELIEARHGSQTLSFEMRDLLWFRTTCS